MTELSPGFRLNGWAVWPASGEIDSPAGRVRVEPKAMAVLVMLAEAGGAVVSREALIRGVWPRGFVTDDVLTRCISQLRKSFGDPAAEPMFLQTIPRRGYRLVCRIEPGMVASPAAPGPPDATLLVLPFQSLGAESDSCVADGLTELLIARLSALRQVRVISRTTAMKYRHCALSIPEIAAQVGATWVVEGSVLGTANRIQVVAQFIDAQADAHVWAETYVRDLEDLLTIQNEIANRVAASVKRKLQIDEVPGGPTATLSALELRQYLRGRQLISRRTPEALREALGLLQQLAAGAPDYAPAWSSIAEIRFMLMHYGEEPAARMLDPCRESLQRALTLRPDDPQSLGLAGILELLLDWRPERAMLTLARALEQRPSYTMAMLGLANACAVTARFAEAEAWMRHALECDPLDVGLNMNLGDHLILQGRFAAAAHALAAVDSLSPGHRPSLLRRAWALALAGERCAAADTLARARTDDAPDHQWLEYAAMVHGVSGDRAGAAAALASLEALAAHRHISAWGRARACAAAGDAGRAMHWLRAAVRARESSVPFVRVTPAFRELRRHPEFVQLVAELGLA
jgi:TolB-like protein/DNA-binding winged helix-turn-helix (wHTH) protein/Tfp pilus assembly protein PilF